MTRTALLAPALLLAACSGGATTADDAGVTDGAAPDLARDIPFTPLPASQVLEPGVRRDIVLVPGAKAPKNPTTGDATPDALNAVQVLRYRVDATPPAAASAIVLAMPGLLGGGGSFDPLARTLVKQSMAAGGAGPVEVWAIDWRSNLMEDTRGFQAAQAMNDPEIAQAYYFGDLSIGGQRFAGWKQQGDVPFESEWGLGLLAADLRAVVQIVPAASRQGHVFLMGHSLGGAFTEAYAGWRFDDGVSGYQELAGLVLVDGLLGGQPSSEAEWHAGTMSSFGPQPGVDDIRKSTRYLAIPILGIEIYGRAEVLSLRALAHPTQVTRDDDRDSLLGVLLGLANAVPKMTDAAALGWAFDARSCPLAFARASLGAASGGPTESRKNPFGSDMILRPSDPSATYGWTDALAASPAGWTPIANLAQSFASGRTNFAEWYFPLRLTSDMGAVGGGNLDPAGWQAKEGLRVFDNAKIDAPVLAVSAGLTTAAAFDSVKTRLAPTVGAGRPGAGKDRSDPSAFKVLRMDTMTHLDPLLAAPRPENPVPGAVLDFVQKNSASGTVTIGPL